MKLTPAHLEEIRTASMKVARDLRAISRAECPALLLLFNSTPTEVIASLSVGLLVNGTKDQWAAEHQRQSRSPDITAAVLVLECWTCNLEPDEPQPATVKERDDKTEALLINVLTAHEQYVCMAPIEGDKIADAPLRLISSEGPDRFEGRFIRPTTH